MSQPSSQPLVPVKTGDEGLLVQIAGSPDGSAVAYELWGNDTLAADQLAEQLAQQFVDRGLVESAARGRLQVALKESLHNAILHGNLEVASSLKDDDLTPFTEEVDRRRQRKTYQFRSVLVGVEFDEAEARITIADQGAGFDPTGVPNPGDEHYADRCHGRGLTLIRAFVDDVRFNERGNEITLVKRRNGAPPA
jgi:anti-sigma regulatory factor (Ser/Thr protein kinase)